MGFDAGAEVGRRVGKYLTRTIQRSKGYNNGSPKLSKSSIFLVGTGAGASTDGAAEVVCSVPFSLSDSLIASSTRT